MQVAQKVGSKRNFNDETPRVLSNSMTGGIAAASLTPLVSLADENEEGTKRFKLNYAPHFNMFKNTAGTDLIDQLKFASDQGFTAWEDNGMKQRPGELQEKIGRTMEQLGMQMGVFIAHGSIGKITFAR